MSRRKAKSPRTAAAVRLLARVPLFAFVLVAAPSLCAHELITTNVYWTQHISRIFFKRCVSCHRSGGSSFPLTTYQEARPWAKAIKMEVLNRTMPPWDAVKGYGAFRNDISLSEREIALISSWVEGGAPEGRRIFLTAIPPEEAFTKTPEPPSEPMVLRESFTLSEPLTAVGIRPEKLAEGGSMQVVAHRPNGAVEHLIWLRDYQPAWRRSYYFREPRDLPAGTKLLMHSAPGAKASLLIQAPSPGP